MQKWRVTSKFTYQLDIIISFRSRYFRLSWRRHQRNRARQLEAWLQQVWSIKILKNWRSCLFAMTTMDLLKMNQMRPPWWWSSQKKEPRFRSLIGVRCDAMNLGLNWKRKAKSLYTLFILTRRIFWNECSQRTER